MKIRVLLFFVLAVQFSFAQVNLLQGLVAHYPFSGNTNDASGNGNHGNAFNGASLTSDKFGNPSSAYAFDGFDDYISTPLLATGTGDYSMSAWVLFNSNTQCLLFYNGNSGIDGYGIHIFNTGKRVEILHGYISLNVTNSTYTPPTGEWLHLVTTRSGSLNSLYVNGVLKHSGTNNPLVPTGTTLIGGRNTSGQSLNGRMDEVRFYNRVLNSAEIQELYSGTSSVSKENATTINSGVSGFKIIPNPNKGSFKVSGLSLMNDQVNYRIMDIAGKVIQNGKLYTDDFEFNLTELKQGVYFVQIEQEGMVLREKLVIYE
jgi:hypothetical protein